MITLLLLQVYNSIQKLLIKSLKSLMVFFLVQKLNLVSNLLITFLNLPIKIMLCKYKNNIIKYNII